MNGDRIAMSQRERDRLKVMSVVMTGERTQAEAARLLRRSVRQVRRIQRRLECEGDGGIVHRLRGRKSNARKDDLVRRQVLRICVKEYRGFGPTLAAEKLTERGLAISAETLRGWMISAKLWTPRRRRQKHRSQRARRECFGELVQTDGSIHDWLEGRGPMMTLLVMIDDATSKVVARFHPAEPTGGSAPRRGLQIARFAIWSLPPEFIAFADDGTRGEKRGPHRRNDAAQCRTSDRRVLGSHSCGALSSRRQPRTYRQEALASTP